MNEEGQRAVRSLTKHVKDLRKLWYLEHEQNRKLEKILQNTSGQSRNRSFRPSTLPVSRDTSPFNLSSMSLPSVKDASLLYPLLHLPLKPLRSAFQVLTSPPSRPVSPLLTVSQALHSRQMRRTLYCWRLNAGIDSIVTRVNEDLGYIRGFDRLDVFVACKRRYFLASAFVHLIPSTFPLKFLSILEVSLRKPLLRSVFSHLKLSHNHPKAVFTLSNCVLRVYFRLFHTRLSSFHHSKTVLTRLFSTLHRVKTTQKAKIFSKLSTLQEKLTVISTAPSLFSSPDKANKPLFKYLQTWEIARILSNAANRHKNAFLRKINTENWVKIAKKAMKLTFFMRKRTICALNLGFVRLKSEHRRQKCENMFKIIIKMATKRGNSLLEWAWQGLNAHHEARIEQKQGLEALQSALSGPFRRKILKNSWISLQIHMKFTGFRAKIANFTIRKLAEKEMKFGFGKLMEKFRGENVEKIAKMVNFAIRRQLKSSFLHLFTEFSLQNSVQTPNLSKLQSIFRLNFLISRKINSKVSHKIRIWHSNNAFSGTKTRVLKGGVWLLTRLLSKRTKFAFNRFKSILNDVILQANLHCLQFSLENILQTQLETRKKEAFECIKTGKIEKNRINKREIAVFACVLKRIIGKNMRKWTFMRMKSGWKRERKAIKLIFRVIHKKCTSEMKEIWGILKKKGEFEAFRLLSERLQTEKKEAFGAIREFKGFKRRPQTAYFHFFYRTVMGPKFRVLSYSLRQIRIFAYNEGRYRRYLSPLLPSSFSRSASSSDYMHKRHSQLKTLTTSLL